ncbi:MAG: phosphoribosyl-AMP cyclohydrolase [Firmicutes bacterium]|nr:phosphoribosyl-AMP cyclohydrolase [Bacillota bacterium]
MQVLDELKFDDKGLIPAVIQEVGTNEVLMVAYMDKEAVKRTVESGRTWFWSRSRQEYWCKGETSGNIQNVKEIRYDCDLDCLLVLVEQIGVACHTGNKTCFFRAIDKKTGESIDL